VKLEDWHIKAMQWSNDHDDHVQALIKNAKSSYPPTLSEDINNPALWKAEHWLWFITAISSHDE